MQTKKRAKPVKFGSASTEAKTKGKASKTAESATSSHKVKALEEKKTEKSTAEDLEIKSVAEALIAQSQLPSREEAKVMVEVIRSEEGSELPLSEREKKTSEDLLSTSPTDKKEDEQEAVAPPVMNPDESNWEEDKSKDEHEGALFDAPPDQYVDKKSMFPYFIKIMVITFVLGLVFFGGIYYAVTNKQKFSLGTKVTPEPTHEVSHVTPTATPLDLSKYTVNVLNGTSISGSAAKLKTQLTDAGFKVGTAGNADNTNYNLTEIAASKKVEKEYIDKLKEVLQKTYQLGKVTTLASGEADVVVTIGSTRAK